MGKYHIVAGPGDDERYSLVFSLVSTSSFTFVPGNINHSPPDLMHPHEHWALRTGSACPLSAAVEPPFRSAQTHETPCDTRRQAKLTISTEPPRVP